MEGRNSLFLPVKCKARGYGFVGYRTALIYFVAENLTQPC
jgi:hypothetical protein